MALDLDLRLPHPRGGLDGREELAFTLANGFAYVELALQAGLPVDAFAPRLSFFFNAHIDFFEEIAKYRAARRIWARWMRDRYGAQSERSMQLRFHTQTAGVSLTAQQPEVNIVRTAIEALAGVLGGTQIAAHQLDGRGAGAADARRRPASRCAPSRCIAYETNVAHVADPLGGSWFVEALTDEMERQAEELFAHLDELGDGSMLEGAIRGHRGELVPGRDRRLRLRARAQVQRRAGASSSASTGSPRATTTTRSTSCRSPTRTRHASSSGSPRSDTTATRPPSTRRSPAWAPKPPTPSVNLMPALIDAVNTYATLGEIMDTLADVFGRHVEVPDDLRLGPDDLILSQYSLRDVEFDERVRVAAEAGFAAIGLAAGEYLRLREAGWTDDRLVTTAANSGLAVDEIEALRLDGTRRNEDVMWRMADMFGASHVHVLGPYVGDMSAAADELARICDEAATHGLRAAIEFFPPTNVPDVRTAMDIVRAADRDAGLCVDSWHHFRGTCDWEELAAIGADRVISIQINDGPAQPVLDDYLEDTLANRLVPGDGDFDLVRFVRSLDAMGVVAPYSVEVISSVPAEPDPAALAQQLADATRRLLVEARNPMAG